MTVGRTKKLKSSQGSREGWTGAKNSIFKSRKKRNILGRKNSSCWMIVSQLNLQICLANTLLALSFVFCVNLNGSRRIPSDRGAWWAAVHEITKNWTPLSNWAQHSTPNEYLQIYYLIRYICWTEFLNFLLKLGESWVYWGHRGCSSCCRFLHVKCVETWAGCGAGPWHHSKAFPEVLASQLLSSQLTVSKFLVKDGWKWLKVLTFGVCLDVSTRILTT